MLRHKTACAVSALLLAFGPLSNAAFAAVTITLSIKVNKPGQFASQYNAVSVEGVSPNTTRSGATNSHRPLLQRSREGNAAKVALHSNDVGAGFAAAMSQKQKLDEAMITFTKPGANSASNSSEILKLMDVRVTRIEPNQPQPGLTRITLAYQQLVEPSAGGATQTGTGWNANQTHGDH